MNILTNFSSIPDLDFEVLGLVSLILVPVPHNHMILERLMVDVSGEPNTKPWFLVRIAGIANYIGAPRPYYYVVYDGGDQIEYVKATYYLLMGKWPPNTNNYLPGHWIVFNKQSSDYNIPDTAAMLASIRAETREYAMGLG